MIKRIVCLLVWLTWLCAGAAQAAKTIYLTYTDAQGTVVAETDVEGNIVARYDYRPYGAPVSGALPEGPGYTGHVNDADSGLVYMQARYYGPWGRMLSVDPVGPVPGNIFSFNRYAYTNNNPVTNTDPDGREVRATYNKKTGTVAVVDVDTGVVVTMRAVSGGRPFGAPIPSGTYDILDHPNPNKFRLEARDSHYGDDSTGSGGPERTELRMHHKGLGITTGCIAAVDNGWIAVRKLLEGTSTSEVNVDSKSLNPFASDTEVVKKFGEIRVVDGDEKPSERIRKPTDQEGRRHEQKQ